MTREFGPRVPRNPYVLAKKCTLEYLIFWSRKSDWQCHQVKYKIKEGNGKIISMLRVTVLANPHSRRVKQQDKL